MQRMKRRSAGYICLAAFHVMCTVVHELHTIERELSKGLTNRERLFIRKRAKHYHEEAEVLRKLGWRLLR